MPAIFSTLAAGAGTIGTAVLGGLGTGAATKSVKDAKKRAKIPVSDPLRGPEVKDAKELAKEEEKRMRRIRRLAGGETILTGGEVGSSDGGKTLLGS